MFIVVFGSLSWFFGPDVITRTGGSDVERNSVAERKRVGALELPVRFFHEMVVRA